MRPIAMATGGPPGPQAEVLRARSGVEILEIDGIIQDNDRLWIDPVLIHPAGAATEFAMIVDGSRDDARVHRPQPLRLAVDVVSHGPDGQGAGQPAPQSRVQVAEKVSGLHDVRPEPHELRGKRRNAQGDVGEPDVARPAEPAGLDAEFPQVGFVKLTLGQAVDPQVSAPASRNDLAM